MLLHTYPTGMVMWTTIVVMPINSIINPVVFVALYVKTLLQEKADPGSHVVALAPVPALTPASDFTPASDTDTDSVLAPAKGLAPAPAPAPVQTPVHMG